MAYFIEFSNRYSVIKFFVSSIDRSPDFNASFLSNSFVRLHLIDIQLRNHLDAHKYPLFYSSPEQLPAYSGLTSQGTIQSFADSHLYVR